MSPNEPLISEIEVTGKPTPEEEFRGIWQQLFQDSPMPSIKGLRISKEEYFRFKAQVQQHNEKRGLKGLWEFSVKKEWGKEVEGGALAFKYAANE